MVWEPTAFDTSGFGILVATPRNSEWLAAPVLTGGFAMSTAWGDVDEPLILGDSSPSFLAFDMAFEANADGLWVLDQNTKAVRVCADPVGAPNTWTENWAATSATAKGRCICPTSSQAVMITAGEGIWRRASSTWSKRLNEATAFGSTTRLYRRCLVRVKTSGVLLAYDPDVGLYKSVNGGVGWFLAWSHTGGGDEAFLSVGPNQDDAYLGDGSTIYRLTDSDSTSATDTWDNAGLGAPVDCLKNATFGCSDGRGDITIITPGTGDFQKIFRSATHTGTETWVDEDEGNIDDFSEVLTSVAQSDTGFIYAGTDIGVFRTVFEGLVITVDLSVSPSTQQEGGTFTGTVEIVPVAPTGGLPVWIYTSNRHVANPDGVITVPAGQDTETFDFDALLDAGFAGGTCQLTAITRPKATPGRTADPSGTSFADLGLDGGIPIRELGSRTYQGRVGGLYDDGDNEPPKTNGYRLRGQTVAATVVPLDSAGDPDEAGKTVMVAVGYSNPLHHIDEWYGFWKDFFPNPLLHVINTCQSGQDLVAWTTPFPDPPAAFGSPPATGNVVWDTFWNRVRLAHTDEQVQIIYMAMAIQGPEAVVGSQDLDDLETAMLPGMRDIRDYLADNLPNLKMIFAVDRTWGGYADQTYDGGNPEPWAYQNSFVVREFVKDSIADDTLPFTTWGPTMWGNGMVPRADDDLIWTFDMSWDGTHESLSGLLQTDKLLNDFFGSDSQLVLPWFGGPVPGA